MHNFYLDDYNLIKTDYDEYILNSNLVILCNNNEVSFNIENDGNKIYLYLNNDYQDLDEYVVIVNEEKYNVIPRFIVHTRRFDEEYKTDVNKLGSFIVGKSTVFRLWSPLAKKAFLVMDNTDHKMEYIGKGLYEYKINKVLDGKLYHYKTIREDIYEFSDPFSYCDLENRSYVIDVNKLSKKKVLVKEKKKTIIYETSVRDFSSQDNLPFKYKKKLLAFTESGLKLNNNSIGVDYLAELGISHLQIMPIFSFDLDGNEYNWGYNPIKYNTFEKSYLISDDPYKQLEEVKEVINYLHSRNIKVNLDVVYNHVYKVDDFNLNKMLPYYFFRYKNYKIGNASLCGNETRSESYFFNEYIGLLIRRFIEIFDIDGLRFDLMGILDLDTINNFYSIATKLKSDFMIYGEGWNMGDIVEENKRASMNNASNMEHIGFFNNVFREVLRGKTLDDRYAYIIGDERLKDDAKRALSGYLLTDFRLSQNINYLECHDNFTMYDKTQKIFYEEDIKEKVCKLGLSFVLLARGIPFIHSGQEFLRTKMMIDDSFNSGDLINCIDWYRMCDKKSVVDYTKDLISICNKYIGSNIDEIPISFDDYYEVIIYKLNDLCVFINACYYDHIYQSDREYHIIFDNNGKCDYYGKIISIPAYSIVISIN